MCWYISSIGLQECHGLGCDLPGLCFGSGISGYDSGAGQERIKIASGLLCLSTYCFFALLTPTPLPSCFHHLAFFGVVWFYEKSYVFWDVLLAKLWLCKACRYENLLSMWAFCATCTTTLGRWNCCQSEHHGWYSDQHGPRICSGAMAERAHMVVSQLQDGRNVAPSCLSQSPQMPLQQRVHKVYSPIYLPLLGLRWP